MTSQAEPTKITHFSHPHPLKLIENHQPKETLDSSCAGCKKSSPIGSSFYSCTKCNYFLHTKCSKMPQTITHPFHKNHVFYLLTKPLYPNGRFNCDACGNQGDGFSYHCKECNIDLHIICAALPLCFTHQSHNHQLNLAFSPPYAKKIFNCDVCNTSGSNHWLYRCHCCGFDVHLNCRNIPAEKAFHEQPQMASRSAPQPQPHQGFGNFGPNYVGQMNQGFQGPNGMPLGQMHNDNLVALQMIQQLANSQQALNQQYLQALLAGGGTGRIGGGGGLGGMQLQQMIQLLSGGGGGIPGLGVDALQSLLGGGGAGGGGGGLDILQGLMGGGGLDLSGLLGGFLG